MKYAFKQLHNERMNFLVINKNKDNVVINGNNNILLSAPHGVSQVRLGKPKHSEIGSLTTALFLQKHTDSFLIAKTKNNCDDANFDEKSRYKENLINLIKQHKIKYLIDIHGLAPNRECDINLGTHLGKNIISNVDLLDDLQQRLFDNNFIVSIDQPYMAGSHTLSGSINNQFNIWTLQIEINCSITNRKENFDRYKVLLTILTDWIKSIKP